VSELVEPAYHDHALSDVLPAVASALGVESLHRDLGGSSLLLPDAAAYVIFLVDGLGAELLTRYRHAAPFLSSLVSIPATAGVPSTTVTSLASLGTGLTSGQHGLVGYTARIPGTGELLNHLTWDRAVDPLEWQPHQTAFSMLAAEGVAVTTVNKREFRGSGLTVAATRGAEFVGADRVGERIAGVLAASRRTPSLTYLYDGDLDWTGHKYGVASTAWLQQLSMVDAAAEQLREALPSSTRLVVVADHGMIDSPTDARIDVDERLELRDGVALIGGEARFRHVYCQRGAVDEVAATWREILGDRATVLTRDQASARGWFGPVDPGVRLRIGDVVVACHGDTAIMSSQAFPYETRLVGLHGSLTRDEMLIPILIA
jgi:hypothetical protein